MSKSLRIIESAGVSSDPAGIDFEAPCVIRIGNLRIRIEEVGNEADAWLYGPRRAEGWISVKDRLPQKGQRVFVYSPSHPLYKARWVAECTFNGEDIYCDSRWSSWADTLTSTYFRGTVTHWQPLPPPPEERT